MQHVLSIPGWRPASLNELMRGTRRARMRLGKRDRELVAAYALLVGIPKATGKRRVCVRFVYPPGKRFHDADAFHKALLDALVACGLLQRDSPRWVELGTWKFERGLELATVITLEDLDDQGCERTAAVEELPADPVASRAAADAAGHSLGNP